jgi:hypothetical protein
MNTIYSSIDTINPIIITKNKKHIYSTLNHCKKNTLPVPLPMPVPVPVPPPLPAKRKKPPPVNRKNKPEIIIFKEGFVEESY